MSAVDSFVAKMHHDGCDAAAVAAFVDAYTQLASGATGMMPESTITPITHLPHVDDWIDYRHVGQLVLPELVV